MWSDSELTKHPKKRKKKKVFRLWNDPPTQLKPVPKSKHITIKYTCMEEFHISKSYPQTFHINIRPDSIPFILPS